MQLDPILLFAWSKKYTKSQKGLSVVSFREGGFGINLEVGSNEMVSKTQNHSFLIYICHRSAKRHLMVYDFEV